MIYIDVVLTDKDGNKLLQRDSFEPNSGYKPRYVGDFEIVRLQAVHQSLIYIASEFKNVPIRFQNGVHTCVWTSELARFLYDNL